MRGLIVVEDPPAGAAGSQGITALAHVANRPIAAHVLEVLKSIGADEVIVASSSGASGAVQDSLASSEGEQDVRLRFVASDAPVDLAGALRLAAPIVGDAPCVAHVASGLLGESLAPMLGRMRLNSPDIVLMVHQGARPDEHLSAASQDLLRIAELDPSRAALGMAGVWLFGPGAIQQVSSATWRSGVDVDLTAVAERIAVAGGSFQFRLVDAWRRFMGDPLDLLELNHLVLDRLEVDTRALSSNGNRIEGRVVIHAGASVTDSMIVGPTVIGPGARIADAYIGPYTSIGAGARVEGAEIERSIIASGASVTHIGGRLVASVVGREARVFRDFSLPRAFRLRVGDGTEVAFC